MHFYLLPLLLFLCQASAKEPQDCVEVLFSEEPAKEFSGEFPISVKLIKENGATKIMLCNDSSKHVVIMRNCTRGTFAYVGVDGLKTSEGGSTVAGFPKGYHDHVVLEPFTKPKNGVSISCWEVLQIPASKDGAITYDFQLVRSGYFPKIDKYLEFTITGSVKL